MRVQMGAQVPHVALLQRLLPVAMQPFLAGAEGVPLGAAGWAAYALWVSTMAYAEGYKAFQLKFCPLVSRLRDRWARGPPKRAAACMCQCPGAVEACALHRQVG